jgi:hypothetical protein
MAQQVIPLPRNSDEFARVEYLLQVGPFGTVPLGAPNESTA